MGEIPGIGVTLYPGRIVPDDHMGLLPTRTPESGRVPAALRDPTAWPEPMRRECSDDRGRRAAALLFLDYDRQGFPYPLVPFHVKCYGSSIIRTRGGIAHLRSGQDAGHDPPGPSAARCFEVGAATVRAFAESPWRVALIASSSWAHAFLTEKNGWIHCDIDNSSKRFARFPPAANPGRVPAQGDHT